MPKLIELLSDAPRARLVVIATVAVACLVAGLGAPDSWKVPGHTDYDAQLESLIEGRAFVDEEGRAIDRYPPAIPLLLSATYTVADALGIDRFTSIRLVSAGFIVVTALVLFEIALLFMPLPCAALAGIIGGTHPHLLAGTFRVLTEIPFSAFFLGAVLFALRALRGSGGRSERVNIVASGTLTAVAMLTRPIALLVPLVTAGAIVLGAASARPVRLRNAALYLGVVLVLLAPWEAFVLSRNRDIVPLSSGGVPGLRDGLSFNHKPERHWLDLPRDVERLTDRFWESYDEFDSVGEIAAFMGGALIEQPAAVVKLSALKATRALYGTDTQDPRFEGINLLLLALYLPLGFVGMARSAQTNASARSAVLYLAALIVLFWLMTTAVLSIARYLVPVVVLVAAFVPAAFRPCAPAGTIPNPRCSRR